MNALLRTVPRIVPRLRLASDRSIDRSKASTDFGPFHESFYGFDWLRTVPWIVPRLRLVVVISFGLQSASNNLEASYYCSYVCTTTKLGSSATFNALPFLFQRACEPLCAFRFGFGMLFLVSVCVLLSSRDLLGSGGKGESRDHTVLRGKKIGVRGTLPAV